MGKAQAKTTRNISQQRGRKTIRPKQSIWPKVAIGVAVIGVLAFMFNIWNKSQPIDGVERFGNLSQVHSNDPQTYAQNPPVGGTHLPVWQNCGVYSQPIRKEAGVHSLEHGASWITYRPDLPEDQLNVLRELARSRPYTLLSPFPDLSSPVVVSAWGVQLKLDNASDARLPRFLAAYTQGPQTPEPGATCSGGISTPDMTNG